MKPPVDEWRSERARSDRAHPRGARPAKPPSPTDPASAWTSKGIRKVSFAHGISSVADLKPATAVGVAAILARGGAVAATTSAMIERTRRRFGLTPSRLAGGAAVVREDGRERVRQLAGTSAFKASARERRKVGGRLAHLTRNLGFRRRVLGRRQVGPLRLTQSRTAARRTRSRAIGM